MSQFLQHIRMGQLLELLLVDHKDIRHVVGGDGQIHFLVVVGGGGGPLHRDIYIQIFLDEPRIVVIRRSVALRHGDGGVDGLYDLHLDRFRVFSKGIGIPALIYGEVGAGGLLVPAAGICRCDK